MSINKYQNPTATKLNFLEGVVLLPMDTLRCKTWKKLSASAKVVYMALLTEFRRESKRVNNKKNEVKITQDQIEAITGLSHTTIVKALFELRGYRRSKKVKTTKQSKNREWKFEECIPIAQRFIFLLNQGGLEKNPSTYSLNGRYLNTRRRGK